MFCYRDMTFCTYWQDCANSKGCNSCLTESVKQEAEDLSMPIAVFANKPDCFTQYTKHIVERVKLEIEFGTRPSCKNCANCTRYEKDANSPIILECNYPDKIVFEVDEDDCCQKWSEC